MKLDLIYLTRKQFIIFLVLTLSYFQPAESEPQVNLGKCKNMLIIFKRKFLNTFEFWFWNTYISA